MTISSLGRSATFPSEVIAEIERAADQGLYNIRGFGTLRPLPSFDDLVLLGASISRYPLEGYRERSATNVTLGTRFAQKPIELKIPITISGMSFGALGGNAKRALGRGASAVGTSTTTGDGGMSEEERAESTILVYQVLPSRYGFDPSHLCACEAIEIVIGQGAKPGGGGMLLGQKITERVAQMRTLPAGIDQRSACRHPDWTGPDDLTIKIQELREATDWQKPVFVKIGSARPRYDVQLAVKAGADVIVLDAGRHRRDPGCVYRTCRHPDLAGLAPSSRSAPGAWPAPESAVDHIGRHPQRRRCRQGVGDGRRRRLDRHRSANRARLQPPDPCRGLPRARHRARSLSSLPTGRCPVGITTQDPVLESRLEVEEGARRVRNFLTVLTMEAQTLARACGKSHLHNLEPEDLAALTVEAAAMAGVPLVGTDWIPGRNAY